MIHRITIQHSHNNLWGKCIGKMYKKLEEYSEVDWDHDLIFTPEIPTKALHVQALSKQAMKIK